ncbi:MAG: DUF2089 domain-containing protein [Chloroflexota bacterium]|nr:DUF2089 domain-containing protein [Chloroflexota bacterium]
MHKLLERCPTCGGELEIRELYCPNCDTVIRGHYAPCGFCQLSEETRAFIRDFVRNRGNLKEMERESGESYWTLRAQLNDVIEELGFQVAAQEDEEIAERRRSILKQVQMGDLNVTEAVRSLTTLKGGKES